MEGGQSEGKGREEDKACRKSKRMWWGRYVERNTWKSEAKKWKILPLLWYTTVTPVLEFKGCTQ